MATIRKRKWTNSGGETSVRFVVDYYDAQGRREKRQFDTRRQADDFRNEIESQIRKGTFRPEAGKVTVKELAELFLKHCEERLTRGERMTRRNFQTYQGYVRNYICPDPVWHAEKHAKPSHAFRFFAHGLANKLLANLTVGTVTRFRDDLRGCGVSVPTTRKIIGMLQVMLAFGISLDLIAVNAARDVEVIAARSSDSRQIAPPDKDVMRELIGLADERFRVVLLFAAATGVRAGELHALRWKHISFTNRDVLIEVRVDPYGHEDVPKTRAGLRRIPLGEAVLNALHEWRQCSLYPNAYDLVFPNNLGTFWDHRGMVKSKFDPLFVRLAKKWKDERRNEVPEGFNWHALRHFAISCWIDAGLPPKTIQTFAGHSSLQVTMDSYGHLFKSDRHASAMDTIAAAIDSPGRAEPVKNAHRKWSDFVP